MLIGLLFVSSLFNYWTAVTVYQHIYVDQIEQQLEEKGRTMAALYKGGPITDDFKKKIELIDNLSMEDIKLADNLTVLGECLPIDHKDPYLLLLREKLFKGESITIIGEHAQCEKDIIAVATPLMNPYNNQLVGAIFVYMQLETVYDAVSEIESLLIIYALLFGLLAIIIGKLITNRLTRNLRQMEYVANKMMDGNFDVKLDINSDDEIGRLSKTVNHLSDSLKETIGLLSKEKKQLSQILDGIRDGVITVDKNGELIKCNCSSQNLLNKLGLTKEEFLELPIIQTHFLKVSKQKEIINDEIEIGDYVLSLYFAPLIEEDEFWGIVLVIHEMTLERKRERDIREFLAMVSHELRTPLSYTKGYTEALIDGIAESKEVEEHYLNTIYNESKRMERLVNDLLDLAQLEKTTYTMRKDEIRLDQIIQRTTLRYTDVYQKKGVSLEYQNVGNKEMWMIGDEDRLTQILVNLLDNALRHTPEGGSVIIKTYLEKDQIVLQVTDTGEGIEKQHLERIGEKFYRIDKARSRKHGGTGLGLAIVKQIIDKLDGKLKIESEVGVGTTFTISFPAA